jgi:hypothetical protein
MNDIIWDQDVRSVLTSLLLSDQFENHEVEKIVGLAIRYARELARYRAERVCHERRK